MGRARRPQETSGYFLCRQRHPGKLLDKRFPQETACQHRIQSHPEGARRADGIPVLWVAGRWLKFSEPQLLDLEDDCGQRSVPFSQVQLHGPHHPTHQCQAWLLGTAGPVPGQMFFKLSRPPSLTPARPTSTPPPTAREACSRPEPRNEKTRQGVPLPVPWAT